MLTGVMNSKFRNKPEFIVVEQAYTSIQPIMIISLIDSLHTYIWHFADTRALLTQHEMMVHNSENRNSSDDIVTTTKKIDFKTWIGHDIERFRKLGLNVVKFKQILYLLYEEVAIELRAVIDRLCKFLEDHPFGYEFNRLMASMIEHTVLYMCMEFDIIFRNVRAQQYLVFERLISDLQKIPNLDMNGYLLTKYNELYISRSIKVSNNLKNTDNDDDNKKKRKKLLKSNNKSNDSGNEEIRATDDRDNNSSNSNTNSSKNNSRKKSKKESICLRFASSEGCPRGEDKCYFSHIEPRNDNDKMYLKRYLAISNLKPKDGLNLE